MATRVGFVTKWALRDEREHLIAEVSLEGDRITVFITLVDRLTASQAVELADALREAARAIEPAPTAQSRAF